MAEVYLGKRQEYTYFVEWQNYIWVKGRKNLVKGQNYIWVKAGTKFCLRAVFYLGKGQEYIWSKGRDLLVLWGIYEE
jgi:hypothetical protein